MNREELEKEVCNYAKHYYQAIAPRMMGSNDEYCPIIEAQNSMKAILANHDHLTAEIDRLRWHEYPELPKPYSDIIIESSGIYNAGEFNPSSKRIHYGSEGKYTYVENIDRWRYID